MQLPWWIEQPWPLQAKIALLALMPLVLFTLWAVVAWHTARKAKRQATQALTEAKSELATIHESLDQANIALARAQERDHAWQQQVNQLHKQWQMLNDEYRSLQQEHHHVQTVLATTRESANLTQQHNQEKIDLLNSNKEQLMHEFQDLSQKLFTVSAEQSKQSIHALLQPFSQQLTGLREKVEHLHVEDSKDRATLKAHIVELHQLNREMSDEAHALSTALRSEHKTQGNWGELVLQRVLERSGLREGEEFTRESVYYSETQRLRPDVVVHLPDERHIVIDSKVSLNAYSDYANAENDEARDRALKAHISAIRQHINGLAQKAYQQLEGIHSPDFVLLFIPIEPAFSAAFAHDQSLFDEAFDRRIVVTSPTILLASLRTVSSIWAIERRNKSTEQIAQEAGKVYDKLALLIERMDKLGKQLDTARKTYDETWHGLTTGQGNLVNTVARFQEVGIRTKKIIAREVTDLARESDPTTDSKSDEQ
ncbi:DNA recombination protein RmuC [Suttonella sp. R2A3]|uniref:DNA recombination protein RmuC n=1 Tax=Suttonella sp. R2A3 TaxID=2908648 RepID=UPI001F382C90|nr:DNA recombination protein RmuC [Suttonella sp. R2A3]UJF23961.1 DNA recombination protein RmuC [Suttonella sp. R2A3]